MRLLLVLVIILLLASLTLAETRNSALTTNATRDHIAKTTTDRAVDSPITETSQQTRTSESTNTWREITTAQQRETAYQDARQEIKQVREMLRECETSITQRCTEVKTQAAQAIPPLLLTVIEQLRSLQSKNFPQQNAQRLTQIREDMMQLPLNYTYTDANRLRERVRESLLQLYRDIANTRLSAAIDVITQVYKKAANTQQTIILSHDQLKVQGVDVTALAITLRQVDSSLTDAKKHIDGAQKAVEQLPTGDPAILSSRARQSLLTARLELRQAAQGLRQAQQTISRLKQTLIPPQVELDPVDLQSTGPQELYAGFQIFKIGVKEIFAWYPTQQSAQENNYYQELISTVTKDASIARGSYPVILFSHGYLGCAAQSAWLTEQLAREGYVVLAVNHNDALCDDGLTGNAKSAPSLLEPETWDESSFADRKDDFEMLQSAIFAGSTPLSQSIDETKIALMGHSLGGYTALGFAGGWPSWQSEQVDAALLLSPYTLPFINKSTLDDITIPIMIQGSILDLGITPFQQPVYDELAGPKYFLVIGEDNGLHFLWTVLPCQKKSMNKCLEQTSQRLATDYAVAFFDKHLKGEPTPNLTRKQTGILSYTYN